MKVCWNTCIYQKWSRVNYIYIY